MTHNDKTTRCRNGVGKIMGPVVLGVGGLILFAAATAPPAAAYPPAVGILGSSRNCLACHVDNGPWNEEKTIIDIVNKKTGESHRQKDGTFLITAKRGESKTVLTIIGRPAADDARSPYRNAWLYVDPERIGSSSLSTFARGWGVNLPMSCRIVSDKHEAYPGANITVLPMTVRPGEDALDAELELQVMLTRGESVKGDASEGMIGNYFERTVRFDVED